MEEHKSEIDATKQDLEVDEVSRWLDRYREMSRARAGKKNHGRLVQAGNSWVKNPELTRIVDQSAVIQLDRLPSPPEGSLRRAWEMVREGIWGDFQDTGIPGGQLARASGVEAAVGLERIGPGRNLMRDRNGQATDLAGYRADEARDERGRWSKEGESEAGGGTGKNRMGRDADAKGKPGSGTEGLAKTGPVQPFKRIIQDSLNSESTTQTSQSSAGTQPATQPSTQPAKPASIAAFAGYKTARFQKYDATILRLVQDFNARKQFYSGGTTAQVKQIPDLDPNLVKSWIIQETGGSPAAWNSDPAQVNVGNWSHYKLDVGLKHPIRLNHGNPESNLRAAIMWLTRKGFGGAGQPAANRPNGTFDGWKTAFERYNGRGKYSANHYWPRIRDRAANPDKYTPIE